ncbi:antibiotic biosynthesis monooxygenase [Jatrophihabitans telluris]|uniref:Antibiotic biosynthesis monooxygenase n=1 Tax=Jatrophihabitans telluris TaxID=2038343 RepID=A0ABY4QUZ7_9ACTN|nr:antibiotic biosynthesis monooxygenase [Jatrophihabitans telluris]UQX87483.1 antibiotic biosynthesis monooxygenase [Jatrophihabitans telluris]
MISVIHFRPTVDDVTFIEQATVAMTALAARPGYRSGSFGRSTDDENAWVLVTHWDSVGAYRRGLGGYEVKMSTPFFAQALDQPSGFEELLADSATGIAEVGRSDLAPDFRRDFSAEGDF